MNKYDKIRDICSKVRIVVGIILIAIGVYTQIYWFFLGIIPLIIGIVKFCPICIITKKCSIPQKEEKKEE
jgi:predicted transporter